MMNRIVRILTAAGGVCLVFMLGSGCGSRPPTLREAAADSFLIGGALNSAQVTGEDSISHAIACSEFATITPENALKWGPVHPERGVYRFEDADEFVDLGNRLGLFVVGHTLVWHQQTPWWVFFDEDGSMVPADTLERRMTDHIRTVMGRYRGRIRGWDVVNEALEEDGSLRQTPWLRILGDDYLVKAFSIARETDPDAELYYNDYNLWKPEKRDGAVRLVRELHSRGVRVDGIGLQGHWGMDYPALDQIDAAIDSFAQVVDQVMITELDINLLPSAWDQRGADLSLDFELNAAINPYTEGLPDSVQSALADRYADLFQVFYAHRDQVGRVTFWGVTDAHSWLNNFPVRGRTAYPLLWDRAGHRKPAYDAVLNVFLNP